VELTAISINLAQTSRNGEELLPFPDSFPLCSAPEIESAPGGLEVVGL
jgi:hypothetical protein